MVTRLMLCVVFHLKIITDISPYKFGICEFVETNSAPPYEIEGNGARNCG